MIFISCKAAQKIQQMNILFLAMIKAISNGTQDPVILKIRVWKDEAGKTWTLDHRRLAAFKLAKKYVPYQEVQPNRKDMKKMATKNGGESMTLKLENGEHIEVK